MFAKYLYRNNEVSIFPLLYGISFYFFHRITGRGLSILHKLALSLCSHINKEKMTLLMDHFVEKNIPAAINDSIFEKLKHHASSGHTTILLSNSPHFLVEKIGHKLGFDKSFGIEIENNNFDKAKKILSMMNHYQILPMNVYAYTDSISDLSLLQIVGHPIGVNPDRKLKRECQKNGWRILICK